jgi:hypothetical protein
MIDDQARLAVLIDAITSAPIIAGLMDESLPHRQCKRIYGD